MEPPGPVDPELLQEAESCGIAPDVLAEILRPGAYVAESDTGPRAALLCPECGTGPLVVVDLGFSLGRFCFCMQDGAMHLAPEPWDSLDSPSQGWGEAELECPEGHRIVVTVEAAVPSHGVSVMTSGLDG